MIQISMIPQEFIDKYNIKYKVHNGYIFSQVTKGMYGLPQAGKFAYDDLFQHLAPYGYYPPIKKLGLWTHDSFPIIFTLVVNNFGVKYPGKEHALHLKSAPEDKYKVTTYWEVKQCIGISLQWDHEKGMIQLSMPGYVRASLH